MEQRKPHRQQKNNENDQKPQDQAPSSLDIRRLTDSLKKLDEDISEIKAKIIKKEPGKFQIIPIIALLCQITGTILILLAWLVQNIALNANNAENLRQQNVRGEIRQLLIATNIDQVRVDFNNYINFITRDTLLSVRIPTIEMYAAWCHDVAMLLRKSTEIIPDGANYNGSTWDHAAKLKFDAEIYQDSIRAEQYVWKGELSEIREWAQAVALSYLGRYTKAMKVAEDHENNIQTEKSKQTEKWILYYKIGSLLLLISLLKGFYDIFKKNAFSK